MITDIVLDPFGASGPDLVEAARAADQPDSGIDGIWVYDHFTAMVNPNGNWSRDPFATLGAFAATTERLQLGTLVANVNNRHVVQLASAINTVQALAGNRVTLGIGSGAAPGSRFAVEHEAIGVDLADASTRRTRLIATIDDLRSIWEHNRLGDAARIVDQHPPPRIIIGASGAHTVRAAALHADGVNIRRSAQLDELVELARAQAVRADFEISTIENFEPDLDSTQRLERLQHAAQIGVDRRIIALTPPYRVADVIEAIS